ncbi:conjugal transfer protein TrbL, partial [Escherichia coli]|nr:conjugal transfer protein TrbL [Escherichia coli]
KNIDGWKAHDDGAKRAPRGGGLGYNAAKARKYAIEQMIARNEVREIARSREEAIKKYGVK